MVARLRRPRPPAEASISAETNDRPRHLSQWKPVRDKKWRLPRFERGEPSFFTSLSITVPYLGSTENHQDWKKGQVVRRKPVRHSRQRRKISSSQGVEMISVPKHWFQKPLQQAMKVLVRPPTQKTRRKQVAIKVNTVMEVFLDLVRLLETGDAKDIQWNNSERSALKPTLIATFFRITFLPSQYLHDQV
ncbi:hypothetical protein AB1Y20_004203 [Prymnesium parvum]|uniref:Condensin complex subunit 2 n=1 Tax=Prymnesium parvum TaxID=97485 RepID=A0AB34J768_PRYPA